MIPCVITIDPSNEEIPVDVQTGDVTPYEIINYLEGLQEIFARKLCEAAEKAVGKDPKKQVEWMDMMIKKHKRS